MYKNNLSGIWQFQLDEEKQGVQMHQLLIQYSFQEQLHIKKGQEK